MANFPLPRELIHLRKVGNSARASGDNGTRNTRGLRQSACVARIPVYHCAFSNFQETLVTTQQVPTSSRKSLTLLQLLGLIGAAGLIASILLNHLV